MAHCHRYKSPFLAVVTVIADKLCVPHGGFFSFSGIKSAYGLIDFGDLSPINVQSLDPTVCVSYLTLYLLVVNTLVM